MSGNEPTIGEYLKQIRLSCGWSQRQAAQLVGIAHSRIGEVERGIDGRTGKSFTPSYPLLLKIAKGYGLDPKSLLARVGYDPGWLELTDEEWRLIALFRSGAPEKRATALAILESHD